MPTVPVVPQNEQRLQGISGARFQAPDTGAGGRAFAGAVQRMGQSIGQAGEAQEEILMVRAEARAKQADNAYQEFERDLLFGETGFYANQNDDAFNAAKPTADAIDEKISSLLAGAKDHRERNMLEGVLTRRRQATLTGIDRYTQAETVKFRVSQAQSGMENASENYARFYATDPDRATEERATLRSEFNRYVDLSGMNDGTMIETEWGNVLSGMHEKVVNAEMLRDPVNAGVYLDKHRAEINPDAATVLDNRLEPLLVQGDATLIADDIMNEGTTSYVEVDVPENDRRPPEPGPQTSAVMEIPLPPSTATGPQEEPEAEVEVAAAPVTTSKPADAATRRGTQRVVSRNARPAARPRSPAAFPRSFRDPAYDALDRTYEAKYGLPEGLLSAIRLHGERSNANQVSSAGARGVYQFIASTRQGFIAKYKIDPWRSPDEQVEAAALHLRDDILKYGSVQAAVAAYNGGHRGVTAPVKETRDYVKRVMSAMGGEGGVAGLPGLPDRGVPGGPSAEIVAAQDLQRQLDMVDPYVESRFAGRPPRFIQQRKDAAKAELKRRYGEKVQGIQVEQAAQWEAAQETAFAMGENFTSITQIPNYNSLPINQRVQLDNLAQSNVGRLARIAEAASQPPEIETDWGFYAQVQELADTDPRALQAIPLDEARQKLSDTEFKEFSRLRTSKPGAKDAPKALTVSEVLSASTTSLNAAGLVTGSSKAARADAAQVAEFSRDMMRWASREQARTGEWPNPEAIRVQADKMLIRMTYEEPGRIYGTNSKEVFAFEVPESEVNVLQGGSARVVVPKDVEKRIRASLPVGASDADVRRIYVQNKGVRW